jgi:hypothetical protein
MATVTRTSTIVHYASFTINGQDVEGTAERTQGGYIFRPATGHKAILVDYRNVDLYLFGVASLADTQQAEDMAHGGYAAIACSRSN